MMKKISNIAKFVMEKLSIESVIFCGRYDCAPYGMLKNGMFHTSELLSLAGSEEYDERDEME